MRALLLLCLLRAAFAVYNPWNGPTEAPEMDYSKECSKDQGSCGCCLIMQKVNMLETYFNTTLSTLEEEYLQTKQSLDNIKASRVAFTVTLFKDVIFKCFGPFTQDSVISYKNVVLNLGGGYNMDTGVFTVPRSGVYSIALTIFSDAGFPGSSLATCATLKVNGEPMVRASEQNREDQEDSATIAVAMQLMAGDQVAVYLPSGCFLCEYSSHFNTFSVFLLYVTD